jgi:hypothetical protein
MPLGLNPKAGSAQGKKKMKIGVQILASVAACATFLPTAFYSLSQSTNETKSPVENAVLRTEGPTPGVRLTSGLMVCDEELYNGRWVSRY